MTTASVATAQSTEATPIEVIHKLFDGMRNGDSAMVHSALVRDVPW